MGKKKSGRARVKGDTAQLEWFERQWWLVPRSSWEQLCDICSQTIKEGDPVAFRKSTRSNVCFGCAPGMLPYPRESKAWKRAVALDEVPPFPPEPSKYGRLDRELDRLLDDDRA